MSGPTDGANDDARISLESLLNDLRHVVAEIDETEWPEVARRVLEHHTPSIGETLLSPDQVQLQRWCRAMLEGLALADEPTTKAAALKVRQYEHAADPT